MLSCATWHLKYSEKFSIDQRLAKKKREAFRAKSLPYLGLVDMSTLTEVSAPLNGAWDVSCWRRLLYNNFQKPLCNVTILMPTCMLLVISVLNKSRVDKCQARYTLFVRRG